MDVCPNCLSVDLSAYLELTCNECGLVLGPVYSNFVGYSEPIYTKSCNTKISKLYNWDAYTTTEKYDYKLKSNIETFCEKLYLEPIQKDNVINMVVKLSRIIKEYKGTFNKNALITYCIRFFTNKEPDKKYIRHLTKIDKILSELSHLGKIKKMFLQSSSIQLVEEKLKKCNIKLPQNITIETNILINKCEENDYLNNSTPVCIAATCLFVTLSRYSDKIIDLTGLANIFGIAESTITKTQKLLITQI